MPLSSEESCATTTEAELGIRTSTPCRNISCEEKTVSDASEQTRTLEIHNPIPSSTSENYVYLDSCPEGCEECATPTELSPVTPSCPCPGSAPAADYWEGRLQDLQEAHAKIDSAITMEYKRAREEIDYRFRKYESEGGGPLPCEKTSKEMIGCLSRSSGQTLQCAEVLREFSTCLDLFRLQKLGKEDERENKLTQ